MKIEYGSQLTRCSSRIYRRFIFVDSLQECKNTLFQDALYWKHQVKRHQIHMLWMKTKEGPKFFLAVSCAKCKKSVRSKFRYGNEMVVPFENHESCEYYQKYLQSME